MEMSQKLIRHQNWNITKSEMSPNWYVTKTEMSANLKCHQNWSFNKTELSPKLKSHNNWNVTKTEMLPYIIFVLKNLNSNSRDRHWIPWSCWISIFMVPLSILNKYHIWQRKTNLNFDLCFLYVYVYVYVCCYLPSEPFTHFMTC